MSDTQKRKRSRFGCHRCKKLKIKCDELKPSCSLCQKTGSQCDYSIVLTWGGRPFKKQKPDNLAVGTVSAFEKKYNSGTKDTSKDEKVTQTQTSLPQAHQLQINIDNFDTFTKKKQQQQLQQQHQKKKDLAQKKNNKNTSTTSQFQPVLLTPVPSENIQMQIEEPQVQSLDDNTLASQVQSEIPLLKAFEEIQTPNIPLKNFLNDVIIPDLSLNFNERNFEDDPDETNSLENSYSGRTSTSLSIRQPNDLSSPPDDLSFMENFILNTAEPSTSLGYNLHNEIGAEFLTGFEKIQPSLMPLPDFLLGNDFYRQHYHLYIEVFSKSLCPAPPHSYLENPFTCLLPQMCLQSKTDGLLSLLIASSVSQSSQLNDQPFPHEIITELTNRALQDLYSRLIDPVEANSDYTLALVMLLSVVELICLGKRKVQGWKAHYFGAKKIIFSRGLLEANQIPDILANEDKHPIIEALDDAGESPTKIVELPRGQESDLSYFFIRWFAYLEVIGSLASSSLFLQEDPKVSNAASYDGSTIWKGPYPTLQDRESLKDIDPFTGFDLRLVEYFSEVVNMARECTLRGTDSGITTGELSESINANIDIRLVQRALELKEKVLKYLNDTEIERDQIISRLSSNPSLKSKILAYETLRATNKIFTWAVVLQIYRRILKLPKDSSLVQTTIHSITNLIKEKIPTDTSAAYCIVFSLLSCGSDSLDEEEREFYHDRFKVLADVGLNSARIAMEILAECWRTGKYWADVMKERQIDLIFV